MSGMPPTVAASPPIVRSQRAKSTVPGNGVSITNCAKVTPARSARSAVASNVSRTVARQAEDERAEHVDAVRRNACSRSTSASPDEVEVLVDVLQPFRRHRLDADERALDARARHRLQELRIFGRLHRDLGEEHHVVGSCASRSISSKRSARIAFELAQLRRVAPARGLRQIGERHRIEVVVGERDEPEPASPQLDDLARSRRRRPPAAASGRRCATPSRTSSASGSRAPSAPRPTCSGLSAADPTARA